MEQEQVLLQSISGGFSWATEFNRIKFDKAYFKQYPVSVSAVLMDIADAIIGLDVKQKVIMDAFQYSSGSMDIDTFTTYMETINTQLKGILPAYKEQAALSVKDKTSVEYSIVVELKYHITRLSENYKGFSEKPA